MGIAASVRRITEKLFRKQFPKAKFCDQTICRADHELRCDLDLQLNHFNCWSAERRVMLDKIYRKVNYELPSGRPGYWNNLRQWKGYDETATIIALSSYENRWGFCSCGLRYSCGDPLCERCCYKRRAEPALREYKRAFGADNECYFIVISLSREPNEKKRLIFTDLTKSEMEQAKLSGCTEQGLQNYGIPFSGVEPEAECRVYWRIFQEVIHEFTGRKKLFSGAFGGPELAIRFLPLAVLPHVNYIAWSPGLCADDLRRLRRVLREKLRGCRKITPGVFPKLSVYRILNTKDYRAVIKYMFKPIDVGFAYRVATDAVDYEPELLQQLNSHVDFFLENLPQTFTGIHRMTRFGFCSPTSGHYMGIVTPERQERREKDAARRKRRQDRAEEIRKHFPEYKPHRRKLTQQQRDDLHDMRYWHRRLVQEGELPGKPPKRWFRKTATKRRLDSS